MAEFTCSQCGTSFTLPESVLARYPGWTPQLCRACRGETRRNPETRRGGARRARSGVAGLLTPEQVLEQFTEGPDTGVFTDGGAVPNPGPGGWGAVFVMAGEIRAEEHGHDPETTNNRMELTALCHGIELVPPGVNATIYTDSNLVARTMNEWAAGWERRGWKRKTGEIKNVDLVKRAYRSLRERPELTVEWLPAHQGYRWNEYADALANVWRLP
jgi:ribonuclease HI